jgi:small subunit ribosomal protein S6
MLNLDGFPPRFLPWAIPWKGGIKMRKYELVFIVQPDLDENAFSEIISRVNGWITDAGGNVEKTDLWGKRTLAYPIRKITEGQYVLMYADFPPEFCVTLERNFRFLEPILRFLIIAK